MTGHDRTRDRTSSRSLATLSSVTVTDGTGGQARRWLATPRYDRIAIPRRRVRAGGRGTDGHRLPDFRGTPCHRVEGGVPRIMAYPLVHPRAYLDGCVRVFRRMPTRGG